MDSLSPTPSPTNAISPLPSSSSSTQAAAGAKRSQSAGIKGKKYRKGEIDKGISNKYLVFSENDDDSKKLNKIIVTPEKRDIVINALFIHNLDSYIYIYIILFYT